MSLTDDVSEYYAARASVYDETAGYVDQDVEAIREQKPDRFKALLAGHRVLEVACGTGYWTVGIAEVATSVLAIDANTSMISQARSRCSHLRNVDFLVTNAYSLERVPRGFTAGVAIYWWSHVPTQCLHAFLEAFHSKLQRGALVLIVDQLPYAKLGRSRRTDRNGNTLERRELPNGRVFEIVKNFPKEEELRRALTGMARNIKYAEYTDEANWNLTYNVEG